MSKKENEQIQIYAEHIRESNHQYFDKLFYLLYPKLVRFAMRYTKQKAAANDIVQETFVMLWENRTNIEPDKSLKSYMFKTVRNRSINWLQSKANQFEVLDEPVQSPHNVADTGVSEDENSTADLFKKWINELPERQKEAFELSRFDGLNHQEIASVMDISEKTVNNHIVSALQILRDNYDSHQKFSNRAENE